MPVSTTTDRGPVPGIKDEFNDWNTVGHLASGRFEVDAECSWPLCDAVRRALARPPLKARLPALHARTIACSAPEAGGISETDSGNWTNGVLRYQPLGRNVGADANGTIRQRDSVPRCIRHNLFCRALISLWVIHFTKRREGNVRKIATTTSWISRTLRENYIPRTNYVASLRARQNTNVAHRRVYRGRIWTGGDVPRNG